MGEKDTQNNKKLSRRKALQAVSSSAIITGGIASGSNVSAEEKKEIPVKVLDGRERTQYIRKAISDVLSDHNDRLTDRLSDKGYSITKDKSKYIVTREEESSTTNVLIPLNGKKNDEPLSNIRNNSVQSSEYNGKIELGHILWKSSEDHKAFAIISGSSEKLLSNVTFISKEDRKLADSGIEVIRNNGHKIEISKKTRRGVQKESVPKKKIMSIDVDEGEVSKSDIEPVSKSDEVTSCPDSIPVILTTLGACGRGCSLCSSLSMGNPSAIFGCIGCAGCGCGLGCCLGERSSSLCAAASSVISIGPAIGLGVYLGAQCVREGCEDNTCF